MKSFRLFLCLLPLLWLAAAPAQAQCDADKFMNHCNARLSNGYTFLKSYNVDKTKAQNNKVEYSYVFSKDTNYMLTLCTKDGMVPNNFSVALFDRDRNMVYSSFDKRTNTFYPAIGYRCSATGIYYLQFVFNNQAAAECGASVLGFKR